MSNDLKTTAIAPWFGCARMLAARVGELLKGCRWVGIPFAGGMPEVAHIDAPTIVVGDVHRHVINLAQCLRHPLHGPQLYRRLRRVPYCEEALDASQDWCRRHNERPGRGDGPCDQEAAYHYFVACWMGRSGKSGIANEFNGGISVRWNAHGGDSNTRYRSAVASLHAWRQILQRCNLVVEDCFDFLAKCQDESGHGIYCDPPFPDCGAKYRHSFSEADHRRLAEVLSGFQRARVVCRFYDHPLVRSLYPEGRWTWHRFTGRKQSNAVASEVLLVNEGQTRSLFDER